MIRALTRPTLLILAFAGTLAACDTMNGGDGSATGAGANSSTTAPSSSGSSSGASSGNTTTGSSSTGR